MSTINTSIQTRAEIFAVDVVNSVDVVNFSFRPERLKYVKSSHLKLLIAAIDDLRNTFFSKAQFKKKIKEDIYSNLSGIPSDDLTNSLEVLKGQKKGLLVYGSDERCRKDTTISSSLSLDEIALQSIRSLKEEVTAFCDNELNQLVFALKNIEERAEKELVDQKEKSESIKRKYDDFKKREDQRFEEKSTKIETTTDEKIASLETKKNQEIQEIKEEIKSTLEKIKEEKYHKTIDYKFYKIIYENLNLPHNQFSILNIFRKPKKPELNDLFVEYQHNFTQNYASHLIDDLRQKFSLTGEYEEEIRNRFNELFEILKQDVNSIQDFQEKITNLASTLSTYEKEINALEEKSEKTKTEEKSKIEKLKKEFKQQKQKLEEEQKNSLQNLEYQYTLNLGKKTATYLQFKQETNTPFQGKEKKEEIYNKMQTFLSRFGQNLPEGFVRNLKNKTADEIAPEVLDHDQYFVYQFNQYPEIINHPNPIAFLNKLASYMNAIEGQEESNHLGLAERLHKALKESQEGFDLVSPEFKTKKQSEELPLEFLFRLREEAKSQKNVIPEELKQECNQVYHKESSTYKATFKGLNVLDMRLRELKEQKKAKKLQEKQQAEIQKLQKHIELFSQEEKSFVDEMVWILHGGNSLDTKGDANWGENHRYDDVEILKKATQAVYVKRLLQRLPEETQNILKSQLSLSNEHVEYKAIANAGVSHGNLEKYPNLTLELLCKHLSVEESDLFRASLNKTLPDIAWLIVENFRALKGKDQNFKNAVAGKVYQAISETESLSPGAKLDIEIMEKYGSVKIEDQLQDPEFGTKYGEYYPHILSSAIADVEKERQSTQVEEQQEETLVSSRNISITSEKEQLTTQKKQPTTLSATKATTKTTTTRRIYSNHSSGRKEGPTTRKQKQSVAVGATYDHDSNKSNTAQEEFHRRLDHAIQNGPVEELNSLLQELLENLRQQ